MTLTIGKKVGKGGANVANDVGLVQLLLNANKSRVPKAVALKVDGKVGTNTYNAIAAFQNHVVKLRNPDSRVDPGGKTMKALLAGLPKQSPKNLTAKFDAVRLENKDNQMMLGRITVKSNTYYFTSGGFGRGNLPRGTYTITKHRNTRSGESYSTDGVGYSFAVSDIEDDRFKGRKGKMGEKRTLLRIHPDGGKLGTNGCIGILGGASTQKSFRNDMNAEIDGVTDKEVSLTVY